MATIALASGVGTAIEWYDYFIYGTAAALVFNKLFFPELSPTTGTIAALATFTVGFIARPIGGIIFGHFGDRIGRKSMLIITLSIMGIGTGLVGLLPTYAAIGIWAPVLLAVLRIAQGVGLGGEWGGAVLMTVEHSPEDRRGFFGSLPQAGVPVGLLLGTAAFALVSLLPEGALMSWGWRIPFLASFVMVFIGLLIRFRVEESPVFAAMRRESGVARVPLAQVLRNDWHALLLGIGIRFCEVASFYVWTTFMLVYGTRHASWSRAQILVGVMIGAAVSLFTMPAFGWLSDRLGRRPVFIFGTIVAAAMAFPVFLGVGGTNHAAMVLVFVVCLGVAYGAMYGSEAAFMSELFPTETRYSGISVSAQFAGVVAGGFAPLIAAALLAAYGHYAPVSIYLVALAAISFVTGLVAPETRRVTLIRKRAPSESVPAG